MGKKKCRLEGQNFINQSITRSIDFHYWIKKVGPVLCISHGMGTPSVGILLHEMIKLMYHAKCKDPIFIRIGTCGGIGVEGGTVVITDDAIDGLFRSTFELVRINMDKWTFHWPTIMAKLIVRACIWVLLNRFRYFGFSCFVLFCFDSQY